MDTICVPANDHTATAQHGSRRNPNIPLFSGSSTRPINKMLIISLPVAFANARYIMPLPIIRATELRWHHEFGIHIFAWVHR